MRRVPTGRRGAAQTAGVDTALAEHELTALWLLGRVPASVLPWPVVRWGRAGTGPGPDVREAVFAGPHGVVRCGDIEVHLAASDFERHGHLGDAAYASVVLHLVWVDDRPSNVRGSTQPLPGGGEVVTVEVGPALGLSAARLRRLLQGGRSGQEPCAVSGGMRGVDGTTELVRREGRRRLAERAWRAAALAAEAGWSGAWQQLLDRALRQSAGRHRETVEERARLAEALASSLGESWLARLAAHTESPSALIELLRRGGLGAARAAEVGWNAALPLLIALAAAYEDRALAERTSRLASAWPAPRPYGRTRALQALVMSPASARQAGALGAQGLLHLQDVWCSRGGCGVCPLSSEGAAVG